MGSRRRNRKGNSTSQGNVGGRRTSLFAMDGIVMDKMRGFFWRCYLLLRGARVGKNFQVHGTLDLLLRDGASYANLFIGDNVFIGGKVYLRMRNQGRIIIANHAKTGTEIWLVTANNAELR